MFVLATTLMTFIQGVTGTPYVTGGDTPAGTDCSGLASWVSNLATGRPAYGDRFHTANEELPCGLVVSSTAPVGPATS
jgi:cell wall-associated NlpC family hydrolase